MPVWSPAAPVTGTQAHVERGMRRTTWMRHFQNHQIRPKRIRVQEESILTGRTGGIPAPGGNQPMMCRVPRWQTGQFLRTARR